jgi:gluconate kinase
MDPVMPATRFDGWLPIRVFWREGEGWVDWCHFGERRLTEPFFRDSAAAALRKPFNQAFRRETPIDALREWRERSPGLPPTAFVYHASRCGSTLVAQMLAALETHIVVSEPPMLDAILRARYIAAACDEETQVEWLRGLVSALAQPRNGASRFVVKLDAWNVFERALMRKAFPDTPWVYLYRDPLEIAVSQVRERGAYMIPGMLGPSLDIFEGHDVLDMPGEEFIARVLGKMFEAGHTGCTAEDGMALHYSELPSAMWTSCRNLFGIRDDAPTREALQAAARWNAKTPQLAFTADSERKQREATPELRTLIDQWAAPAYRELERARAARPAHAARAEPANQSSWS